MELNRLKMFQVVRSKGRTDSELFIYTWYQNSREVGMRSIIPYGQFHNWEFPLLFEGYLENGDIIYVNAVQYMCVHGEERIMITYLNGTQQVCVTADRPENLGIYVVDPRPFMTPAGRILYGE